MMINMKSNFNTINMKNIFTLLLLLFAISANGEKITGEYKIPDVPDWAKNAVFYQIYPQTFSDSDGDGIGDLNGIINKLDYVKSLGVDAIWLNPFFDSPFNDAGYDIRDYYKVAPRYGTNDDAKRLFDEAHKRGLKVIFDYVISYTAIDHPWFKESCKEEKNKYSNYYIWTETNWIDPPKEFAGSFIKGYARRNGQFMRNFFWSQPALNFGFSNPDPNEKWQLPTDHPDVKAMKEDLKDVLRFWMKMGADGFRADMAGALTKTSHTNGNEQFFNTREDATKLFWREIRALLEKEYPHGFMVAEWSYPTDALDKCFHVDFFHWFNGYNDLFQKESWRILNGVSQGHSYFDVEGKGNITNFLKSYMGEYENTKGKGYISIPLGNHDNARLGNKRSDKDLEIIYAFGFTMPGVPFLYYGNEIGMKQLPTTWPQVEGAYQPRNGARTPMQWDSSKNLGFSTADASKLYLPVDPASDAPNVESQEKDENSLLNKTRKLIKLRKSEPALADYAEFVPLYAKENTYPFVYARAAGDDVVLVMLNPRGEKADATFQVDVKYKKTKLLAGDKFDIKSNKKEKSITISMSGQSYAIVRLVK